MSVNSMSVWRALAYVVERKEARAWWRQLLGRHFETLSPWMKPCTGEFAGTLPCPETGHPLTVTTVRERRVAYAVEEYACDATELHDLRDEDLQLWRIDAARLREHFRQGMNLRDGVATVAERVHMVGQCRRGTRPRRVYMSLARDEREALLHAERVITHAERQGCVLMSGNHDDVGRALNRGGLAHISLDADVRLTGEGITVVCDGSCERLARQDMRVDELKGHLDARIDQLGRTFADMERENAGLKDRLAGVLADIARKVEPEFFQWICVILGEGSANAAAKRLGIPGSTFAERVKAYAARGGIYKSLYGFAEARSRRLGRRRIARFDEVFTEARGQEGGGARPNVLRELLDGLEGLSSENWETLRNELIELVRGEVPEE